MQAQKINTILEGHKKEQEPPPEIKVGSKVRISGGSIHGRFTGEVLRFFKNGKASVLARVRGVPKIFHPNLDDMFPVPEAVRISGLFEARFRESDVRKVERLIVKVLGRRLGTRFYRVPGIINFITRNKKKQGVLFVADNLKAIRFNWTQRTGSEIESADIWDGIHSEPRVNIDLTGKNVVQLIDGLVHFLRKPRPGKVDVAVQEGFEEALSPDVQQFIDNQGITADEFRRNRSKYQSSLRRFKRDVLGRTTGIGGQTATVVATRPRPEHSMPSRDVERLEKEMEKLTPDEIFSDLEDLTRLVAQGKRPSLLVTGSPGTGKSTVVMNTLEEEGLRKGQDWVIVKGATTDFGMYDTLYRNRDKLILYDDSDSVFKNEKGVNLLKAALETGKDKIISWVSKNTVDPDEYDEEEAAKGKLPSSFEFNGRIIFISNLDITQIDSAVRSRSLTINVKLDTDDMLVRMRQILPKLIPDAPLDLKQEVLDHMNSNRERLVGGFNLRTLEKAIPIAQSGARRWKEMVILYTT